MFIKSMSEKFIKKMEWYDISLIKSAVFFATLFLVSVWPAFTRFVVSIGWPVYLVITVVLMIPLWKKMFS